jgi:hypothetical protein
VRDEDRRPAGAELLEALEHLELGPRVEGGRGLVQDQQLRVAHVGARDRDLLPLAAGEVHALAEALADDLVVARGSRRMTSSARLAAAAARSAPVARASMRPTAMFSRGGQVITHEVLEDHADVRAQLRRGRTRAGRARPAGCALVGLVEARQQLHQRRLARAVLADERQHLAGAQREREVRTAQRSAPGSGSPRPRSEALADGRGIGRGCGGDTISGRISKNEKRSSR